MGRKISVAFLWHMHQPPYLEPRGRVFLLPWAYLHGTKDYYDMGAAIRRHPGMRANVNFTPSLLEQLDQYARDEVPDQTLRLMAKPPDTLTRSDRAYLLRTCMGIPQTMIGRFPRYVELFEIHRAAQEQGPDDGERFDPCDCLDLIVLFLLAWCGPTLSQDPEVQALVAKGRNFSTDDRDRLMAIGREFVGRIVPLWRELAASGQVELSTTPFNHPILPLLIDNGVAVQANPGITLPDVRFEAPYEAARQVDLGLSHFERTFGFRPGGMWPAEGAVSEAAVALLGSRGVRWIATDEEILRRSLGGSTTQAERFSPHVRDGVSLFFRDHFLSDQVGFVYSRWSREQAVAHFMTELRHRALAAPDDDGIVLVALDGENAWEFYPDGGYPFLDALYHALSTSDFARPVTLGEHLDRHGPGLPLETLATGSWIDGELDTWIGDPAKNRAWSYLSAAWQTARDTLTATDALSEQVRTLMLRAEASDWFWWFGEGHVSIHEREFDYLFRQNLKAIYEALDVAPPEVLDRPVGHGKGSLPLRAPTSLIRPRIDGRRGAFYKWVGAGSCDFAQGSIHRLQPIVTGVRFGYDERTLYVRCEGFAPMREFFENGHWMRLAMARPQPCEFRIQRGEGGGLEVARIAADGSTAPVDGAAAAVDDVVEIALPIRALEAPAGRFAIEFHLVLGTDGLEAERFPWDSVIDLDFDPKGFELTNWFV
jgi:alpha-amylase/alpha-mannosidase (GH57 family)